MAPLTHVRIAPLPIERFRELLEERYAEVEDAAGRARDLFAGRVVWHVNSTAKGGGVVELLSSLLAYTRGAGIDARWVVIEGEPRFFGITKRIHNNLHGSAGDGGDLGDDERAAYEAALRPGADELGALVRAGDVVFLHDPQTAGMIEPVRATGARVVWRCHVGLDLPNATARRAWEFLLPYVRQADAYVFSRREFVWEGLDGDRVWIVPPSIDAFSPKNQFLAPETVASILHGVGLLDSGRDVPPTFSRQDGTPGRVDRVIEVDQEAPLPAEAPVVTQVSRWDRLKDPAGILTAFAEHMHDSDAHLVLAGPAVAAVSDDPEGAEVLAEVRVQRASTAAAVRRRVHLACLPMDDVEENAAIVNAIQRHSDVVVQKSLAEGFGLTVAEAMWKARPVVATRVGGIQDQIVSGESGVLLNDPSDPAEFAAAVGGLLDDPHAAARIGAAAHARVLDQFLGVRHLLQYLDLIEELV
jgi:trehalose synthase